MSGNFFKLRRYEHLSIGGVNYFEMKMKTLHRENPEKRQRTTEVIPCGTLWFPACR
jgi:hypothetical protein